MEQAKLWLQFGPVEAGRVLVGVLRTALLFGGTVVVDRNQLLEGIFFISMPPDRLAWHLGLEPAVRPNAPDPSGNPRGLIHGIIAADQIILVDKAGTELALVK